MNNDIELLQDWLTRHRQTEMNYDCNPTRYECQIFDAIEHIICENAQYSEHNMKLEQALIDTDRELREYKKALELACNFISKDYCFGNRDSADCLSPYRDIDACSICNQKYYKNKAKERLKDENKETC